MAEALAEETEREEEDYRLSGELVEEILDAVEQEDADRLSELLEPLHAADIADLIEQVSGHERREILRLWGRQIDGEILTEIDEGIREEVLASLPPEVLADAVRELDSDDVVDLIEDLEEPQQEAILGALDETDRAAVEKSLGYPEYSAGRLMQREVVTAPEHWTVGETIDFLRKAKWLPDQFYHVTLVDPGHHPVGNVTLGRILSAPRASKLIEICEEEFRKISAYQDEGDVAYAFNQYHLISAPVVDEDDRLVGVITIDDAMSVLDEEHEEDILRLAGVGDESAISDTVLETVRQRLPWLFINLLTAILASAVISIFEGTIQQLVALAVLMPIVASMGGNAGTQTLTVAVRALATRDLTDSNVWRVVRREAIVGLLNGLAFAVVMGAVAAFWFSGAQLGIVIGLAMVINLVVAALSGILIPLALEKLGADPALASGTFVTTMTDVVGFFAFLGLASVVLL
ncbi:MULTISPECIES: magnesium transporter [unclassified Thioclava]|uniref:magnesium transporter n=1 Tax=unclassified Thioclava TaxID=2621713 RepID=UPI000997929B|nr:MULTISPECIES: magnesium transporter [unclassified Thioclava]MPQ92337.1 magnesium transporter [Thioclava sp. JE_KL1]OOY06455.1 magnesium transporter [Thioclava sp. F28-4]OOY10470.1 magnesium transporter [Thioclava sp. F36-7]OOY33046.1 magnesium transporter [Thioclava sp. F36-6]